MKKKSVDDLIKERRGKVFLITRKEILKFFVKETDVSFHITRINLPDNFFLRDVQYCWSREAFAFLIFSEEFSSVDEGAEFPVDLQATQFLIRRFKCTALTKGDIK